MYFRYRPCKKKKDGKTCIGFIGLEYKMEEKKYQTDCKCDTSKAIKGVMCDVQNCAYHNGKSECCAGCISVGPSSAESSSGTACVTFKPKAY